MALLPAPAQADFTINLRGAGVAWDGTGTSLQLSLRGNSGNQINGVGVTLAGGWSRIDAEGIFTSGGAQATSASYCGMWLRNSANGRIWFWGWRSQINSLLQGQVQNWTSTTARSGFIGPAYTTARPRFLRVDCDGTNIIPYYGDDWDDIGYLPSEAASQTTIASFLLAKPDQAGICVIPDSLVGSGGPGMCLANLVGWRVI